MAREIDNNLEHLHPVFREKVQALSQKLAAENLPFRLFEGFRTPQRQRQLYSQGRTAPPWSIVTKARPWQSNHQYGLAADFVLFENNEWSWDDSGSRGKWWSRLHELARQVGLQPLSWELPHLELVGLVTSDLHAGQYPPGGDETWAENLEAAIYSWSGDPEAPPLPRELPDRPALADQKVSETLQLGSSGADVVELQKKLKALGFDPGSADGIFGDATEAAVIAFQKSAGLLADGIVGPKTLAALELQPPPAVGPPSSLGPAPEVTVEIVSRMFPDAHKSNIKKYLPFVLKALQEEGLMDKKMVLMALATIRAETAGFEPISEYKSKYNTSPSGHPYDLYDFRKDLGNKAKGDGDRFKGRGFIQLTGHDNYQNYGKALGLGDELVTNPDRANDPEIAAKLLAKFLKDRERDIKEALLDGSFATARRLVNGGRHGLAAFTEAYQLGETLLA